MLLQCCVCNRNRVHPSTTMDSWRRGRRFTLLRIGRLTRRCVAFAVLLLSLFVAVVRAGFSAPLGPGA